MGEANANGEEVRPIRGRKSKMRHSSVKLEADTVQGKLQVSVGSSLSMCMLVRKYVISSNKYVFLWQQPTC